VALGTGAVMCALSRERIGRFELSRAIALNDLTADSLAANLMAPSAAVAHMRSVALDSSEIARLRAGLTIDRRENDVVGGESVADEITAISEAGELVSIIAPRGPSHWAPVKNFLS
jgi:tRNA U55 pseudouridine synthase TruB